MKKLINKTTTMWVLMIGVTLLGGVLRGTLLEPGMGALTARWITAGVEMLVLLLLISLFLHSIRESLGYFRLMFIGLWWTGLTLCLDLVDRKSVV